MNSLIQTAELLLGRELHPSDGYTLEEIQQVEDILGLKLPNALKDFYHCIGKIDMLTSSFERFLPLNELQKDDEKIIFLEENQNVCLWSTNTLGDMVWIMADEDWAIESMNLADFIQMLIFYNCAQGGFEFGGIADDSNFAAILKSIEISWNKVVHYNGLIIYSYQDNLIWYFYKEDNYTPTSDGIFLSCRTCENFNAINSNLGFRECF